MWAAIGTGLLLKGLIAAVFPVASGAAVSGADAATAGRGGRGGGCRPFTGMLLLLAIAAPWHVLATLRNPPYFDFTMHSEPGSYHGFFWFYFINEHVLRFLNLRYPRDYNTVPRLYFWLFHLLWFFPWSVYFPAACEACDTGSRTGRRGRACCACAGPASSWCSSRSRRRRSITRCRAIRRWRCCWAARWRAGTGGCEWGTRAIGVVAALALAAIAAILWTVRGLPAPGDISAALTPESGRLHAVAGAHDGPDAGVVRLSAAAAGGGGSGVRGGDVAARGGGGARRLALVAMMVLFFHAARLALVVFDPYLSSRPLAEALLRGAAGEADRGRPVLHVLLGFLLHEPAGAVC